MIYYLTYLKDQTLNNSLGLNISAELVEPFLAELETLLDPQVYKIHTDLQKQRDNGRFYITLISVGEYNQLSTELGIDKFINSLEPIFHYQIDDLKMLGIGSAFQNENRSYFIVCKSQKLDSIRSRFHLDPIDLHLTLGFRPGDVYGVRKNQLLKKETKFLQLLAAEFYKNDWGFIRKIKSFDLPQTSDIIPVEITDTRIKVKCAGYYMDITHMQDSDDFQILTRYPIVKELPRLSETEIAKILNKK